MQLEPVYPFPAAPPAGTTECVAPGVFWLRMPLPFALDHINLWVLEDGDGLTVVDTGYASDLVRTAWDSVLAGFDRPVKRIVVTHFHPDHLGLASWLQEKTGASIAMSMGEYLTARMIWHQVPGLDGASMVRFFRRHGLSDTACAALEKRGNAYRHGVPQLPEQYRRLIDGDELMIGSRRWRVNVGHGHAVEHVALQCVEEALLISGDMLLPRITSNVTVYAQSPDDDTLGYYLASLNTFGGLPEGTLVLPAHGLPFRNLHGRIAALMQHHEERLDLLDDACASPQTAAGLLPVLFGRDDFDPHQNMFAMGEAVAHLNHLRNAGRLTSAVGVDGVIRFSRRPA